MRPVWTMLLNESSRWLPGASGIRSRCVPSGRTKPGAPPRGDASWRPWASAVDSTTKGDSAMKAMQCWSSAVSCLRSARSPGAGYSARSVVRSSIMARAGSISIVVPTATVPVVMAFAGDAMADGLVSSLARPGGMTTGLSAAVGEIAAKRIELLQAVLPKSARVVLLAAPAASHSMVSATETAGRAMGLRVSTQRIRDAGDVARALTPGPSERIDGVIVDLVIRQNTALILELSRDRRWPTVSGPREFAEQGGLMAYGPNYPDMFRRAASYVDIGRTAPVLRATAACGRRVSLSCDGRRATQLLDRRRTTARRCCTWAAIGS